MIMANNKFKAHIETSDFIKRYNQYGSYSLRKLDITPLYNNYVDNIEKHINNLHKQNNIMLFIFLMDCIFYYLIEYNQDIIDLYNHDLNNNFEDAIYENQDFSAYHEAYYDTILENFEIYANEIANSFINYAENNNLLNLITANFNTYDLSKRDLIHKIEHYVYTIITSTPIIELKMLYSHFPIEYNVENTFRKDYLNNINLYNDMLKYDKKVFVVLFLMDTKCFLDNSLHRDACYLFGSLVNEVEKSEVPFNCDDTILIEEL